LKVERERERESRFNTAGGTEFQVRGAANYDNYSMLNHTISESLKLQRLCLFINVVQVFYEL